jgi:molybdopterin-binding protein
LSDAYSEELVAFPLNIGLIYSFMTHLRVSEAAHYLGVSDDTVRRWVEAGRLGSATDASGRLVVDGAEVAALMAEQQIDDPTAPAQSARNRFPGIVTRVEKDGVMALVEIQAGPHRVISLMSREAADELGLAPGVRAAAVVKATNVIVDTV